MKLFVMQLSPTSSCFLSLVQIFSSAPFSNALCSSLNVKNQLSHQNKQKQNTILYILIFTFSDSSREGQSMHYPNSIPFNFFMAAITTIVHYKYRLDARVKPALQKDAPAQN
jgi:hypothetical protein